MNRALTSPLDPFLSPSSFDPPASEELLEFLIQAGIARKHPNEEEKIALVDFAGVAV